MNAPVSQYLETLRRVPDDVILSVATREFDMPNPRTCLCAWLVREQLAQQHDTAADDEVGWAIDEKVLFGGTSSEWAEIYVGVLDRRLPAIELAFVDRVAEAVRGAK